MKPAHQQFKLDERQGFAGKEFGRDRGAGAPSGSELPPVLNGVTCVNCGEHLGKAYRVGPKCSNEKACERRVKANARFERERLAILEAKEKKC